MAILINRKYRIRAVEELERMQKALAQDEKNKQNNDSLETSKKSALSNAITCINFALHIGLINSDYADTLIKRANLAIISQFSHDRDLRSANREYAQQTETAKRYADIDNYNNEINKHKSNMPSSEGAQSNSDAVHEHDRSRGDDQ